MMGERFEPARPGPGRKRKPMRERLHHQVAVMLDEKDVIELESRMAGQPASAYVRDVLREHFKRSTRKVVSITSRTGT